MHRRSVLAAPAVAHPASHLRSATPAGDLTSIDLIRITTGVIRGQDFPEHGAAHGLHAPANPPDISRNLYGISARGRARCTSVAWDGA
jgi:hypothetical protein